MEFSAKQSSLWLDLSNKLQISKFDSSRHTTHFIWSHVQVRLNFYNADPVVVCEYETEHQIWRWNMEEQLLHIDEAAGHVFRRMGSHVGL